MIRNIVFDMGKVLLDYDPLKVCYQYTEKEEEIRLLDAALFSAPEWILLDQGAITEEEAMVRVRERMPDQRMKRIADLCMAHWHEYNIEPKPGMEELVKELKEKGYCLYILSNASLRFRVFQDRIPGFPLFDGVLVSAEERLLKPEPAIYQRLFEKFGLRPEESLFVDDLEANIEGARACGMDGYCFAHGDAERLRSYLEERLS